MRACATLWICTVGFLFLTSTALAQSGDGYQMKGSKVAGGGGTTTGGGYNLRVTLGQHDAGRMSGGGYTLIGGFWHPPCLPPTVTGAISSRYIQIEPDTSITSPVGFHIECGAVTEWVQLIQTGYDDGGGVFVNIGKGVADCASADFLTPDQWTNSGANALYVTGLAVAPDSKPMVTAKCVDCSGAEAAAATPVDSTWVYCDSSGDGQVTFVFDLFKQFANTSAGGGGPNFLGPAPGIEVDTQGDSPSVPDQQVTVTFDIFPCFLATTAGGSAVWTGEICP